MFAEYRPTASTAVARLAAGIVTVLTIHFTHQSPLWAQRGTSPRAVEDEKVTLAVGEQYSIPALGIEKYSEGTPGIVDVRLPDDATEFIVVGIKPGLSSLLLIREDGRKRVINFQVKGLSSEVPKRENIRLDFYFVELRHSGGYQVGVNWPSQIGADLGLDVRLDSSGISGATASLSNIPLPRLDLLHHGGWATIARQASIITSNGEEADFKSGGQVNIPVQGALTAEIQAISYGTHVKIRPRYDRESGRLELRVQAEVSALGGEKVPSRNVTSVRTVVNVERNQAIVLAGLFSKERSRSRQGLPLLSQIPVLGTLFGSHGGREQKVQNVVFIVPSVVDLVGSKARLRLQRALEHYESFSGDMGSVDLLVNDAETP